MLPQSSRLLLYHWNQDDLFLLLSRLKGLMLCANQMNANKALNHQITLKK
jgi:hypothetical protein